MDVDPPADNEEPLATSTLLRDFGMTDAVPPSREEFISKVDSLNLHAVGSFLYSFLIEPSIEATTAALKKQEEQALEHDKLDEEIDTEIAAINSLLSQGETEIGSNVYGDSGNTNHSQYEENAACPNLLLETRMLDPANSHNFEQSISVCEEHKYLRSIECSVEEYLLDTNFLDAKTLRKLKINRLDCFSILPYVRKISPNDNIAKRKFQKILFVLLSRNFSHASIFSKLSEQFKPAYEQFHPPAPDIARSSASSNIKSFQPLLGPPPPGAPLFPPGMVPFFPSGFPPFQPHPQPHLYNHQEQDQLQNLEQLQNLDQPCPGQLDHHHRQQNLSREQYSEPPQQPGHQQAHYQSLQPSPSQHRQQSESLQPPFWQHKQEPAPPPSSRQSLLQLSLEEQLHEHRQISHV